MEIFYSSARSQSITISSNSPSLNPSVSAFPRLPLSRALNRSTKGQYQFISLSGDAMRFLHITARTGSKRKSNRRHNLRSALWSTTQATSSTAPGADPCPCSLLGSLKVPAAAVLVVPSQDEESAVTDAILESYRKSEGLLLVLRVPPSARPKQNALRSEDRVLLICRPGKCWNPLLVGYQECCITNRRHCHHVTPRFLRTGWC